MPRQIATVAPQVASARQTATARQTAGPRTAVDGTPTPPADYFALLADGVSFLLLADGTSKVKLSSST